MFYQAECHRDHVSVCNEENEYPIGCGIGCDEGCGDGLGEGRGDTSGGSVGTGWSGFGGSFSSVSVHVSAGRMAEWGDQHME